MAQPKINHSEGPPLHGVLTVAVEDYYHVAAMSSVLRQTHWERLESRISRCLQQTLELLARYQVRATFFVLGCVAERQPEVVQQIVAAGHEIASRGYLPRSAGGLDRGALVEDIQRTREALERAGANRIRGFRFGSWLRAEDLWILDVLMEQGYSYDSSINPILRRFAGRPVPLEVSRIPHSSRPGLGLWEFPVSSVGLGGVRLPIAGGNYTRQLPHSLLKHAVDWWMVRRQGPLVFYFMPWELDQQQPQVASVDWLTRVRQYRNLDKIRWVLEEFFGRYHFGPIGDHLGIPYRSELPAEPPRELSWRPRCATADDGSQRDVALVIPIYNEEQNIAYLAGSLDSLRREMAARGYRLQLVMVDDCSSDNTGELLQQRFGGMSSCLLVRHEQNRGVAAAILTGIRVAPCDVVCSIDCDMSYDPLELLAMIPCADQAELVTASPYHPRGEVVNVPRWRLFLSHNLSRGYSAILGQRLYTFTSCCRVYRKQAFASMELSHGGFLGVAEMLIRLQLAGGRVVEHPARLESRLFGESKMKVLSTIGQHLGLLQDLLAQRLARAMHTRPPWREPPGAEHPGAETRGAETQGAEPCA